MNVKLIFTIGFLLATISPLASAHDADDDDADESRVTAEDVVLDRQYPASVNAQALHVVIHKAGHLDAKPFVVEVSESCAAGQSSEQAPERVIDTASACDVAPNTVSFDERTSELAMLMRQPDEDGVCQAQPKRVIFQLRSACGEVD